VSGTTLGTGTVVSVGTTPDGVGIDGGNAFIANEGSNNVSVVDPPTHTTSQHQTVATQSAEAHAALQRHVTLMPLVAPLR
jgi:YVTN family beta-propeller protein